MVRIIADYREKRSGIPDILISKMAGVAMDSLPTGDYIVNGRITIERKSSEDFIQSIINHRIFGQCARLKKNSHRSLIIIEGNPYHTEHKIHPNAIRGAVISIMVSWQVPIIYSKNPADTADLIILMGNQDGDDTILSKGNRNYKSKRIKSQRLSFLQGIPCVGPTIAHRLIANFGNIKAIVNASQKDLRNIEGIGKRNAMKICDFLEDSYT